MLSASDDPIPSDAGAWVRAASGEAPGVWAARARLTVEAPIRTHASFEARGGFELFVDSEGILRSGSGLSPDAVSHGDFELNLLPGRHEVFVRLWTISNGEPPEFRLSAPGKESPFATGSAPWVAARLENVQLTHPFLARVLAIGEPTGPGGMDRGADWQPVESLPEVGDGVWDGAVQLRPIAGAETWKAERIEGEGTIEEFRSIFGRDGLFRVAPNERAIVRIELPRIPVHVNLRASGGESALIRIGTEKDPINADVYGPRGFRQDFASLAPFEGDEMTVILEGGERGMALFRLEFLEEIGV